jgi:hypothetical protein
MFWIIETMFWSLVSIFLFTWFLLVIASAVVMFRVVYKKMCVDAGLRSGEPRPDFRLRDIF